MTFTEHEPWNKNQPERAIVERIAGEEAKTEGVPLRFVLGMSRSPRAIRARQSAMRRIIKETGCSIEGLAAVWGCYQESVRVALGRPGKEAITSPAEAYDAVTVSRLRWRYGDARASQIVAGRDPKTQRDLAAWNSLGSRRAVA